MSLDIEWSGPIKQFGAFSDETLGFVDKLVEVGTVTVAVSTQQNAATPGSTQTFSFVSNPASFASSFSVVGTEQNGIFASRGGPQ